MYVIDASVYVALVKAGEPAFERCWTWFQEAQDTGAAVMAPAILLAEVAAAISRGVGQSDLARQATAQILQAGLIEMLPVSVSLGDRAAAVAAGHGLRGCDAVYVALAEQQGATLVTLDRQQLDRGAEVIPTRAP